MKKIRPLNAREKRTWPKEVLVKLEKAFVDVVLDFGLWSRDERSALRQAATDRGADVELHYRPAELEEQRRWLARRQADEPHTTWPMSADELARWAEALEVPTEGELDGSEPVGDPPPGFATWDLWRAHRWPSTVSRPTGGI